MKINQLIQEAQFAKPIYTYHATRKKYLKSILKHGLIPNFKKDGYGSGERNYHAGYSLESLPGIYLTKSPKDALSIGKSIDDNTIILVCKIQLQQSHMDEDSIADIIDEFNFVMTIRKDFKYIDVNEYIKNHVTRILKNDMFASLIPHQLHKIQTVCTEYLNSLAKFIISSSAGENGDETELRKNKNELTKQLRYLIKNSQHERIKIDQPITFSGGNRIVGICDYIQGVGWGDITGLQNEVYHMVKTPIEL